MRTLLAVGLTGLVIAVGLTVFAPQAQAHETCSVANTPVAGGVTCAEPSEGLSGFFDEDCGCWEDVTLFGFGDHSAAAPGEGQMQLLYQGNVLVEDSCSFPDAPPILPLNECETRGSVTLDTAPSGFCFDVTASTSTIGGVDQVVHNHTFCAPR